MTSVWTSCNLPVSDKHYKSVGLKVSRGLCNNNAFVEVQYWCFRIKYDSSCLKICLLTDLPSPLDRQNYNLAAASITLLSLLFFLHEMDICLLNYWLMDYYFLKLLTGQQIFESVRVKQNAIWITFPNQYRKKYK